MVSRCTPRSTMCGGEHFGSLVSGRDPAAPASRAGRDPGVSRRWSGAEMVRPLQPGIRLGPQRTAIRRTWQAAEARRRMRARPGRGRRPPPPQRAPARRVSRKVRAAMQQTARTRAGADQPRGYAGAPREARTTASPPRSSPVADGRLSAPRLIGRLGHACGHRRCDPMPEGHRRCGSYGSRSCSACPARVEARLASLRHAVSRRSITPGGVGAPRQGAAPRRKDPRPALSLATNCAVPM